MPIKVFEIQINIGGMAISNSKYESWVFINDNKVTFELHVRSLCKKASQKLNAFARIEFSGFQVFIFERNMFSDLLSFSSLGI